VAFRSVPQVVVPVGEDDGTIHDPAFRAQQRQRMAANLARATGRAPKVQQGQQLADMPEATMSNKSIFDKLRPAAKKAAKAADRRGGKRVTRRPAPALAAADRLIGPAEGRLTPGAEVAVFSLTGAKVNIDGNWDGYVDDAEAEKAAAAATTVPVSDGQPRGVATRDFVAQNDDESFEVRAGDVLVLLECDPSRRWWVGHLEIDPELQGEFPSHFVERVEEPAPEPEPEPAVVGDETAVDRFLASLGLPEYQPIFQAHMVDRAALAAFTEDDLWELGIPKGPRVKIRAAIQRMQAGASAPLAPLDHIQAAFDAPPLPSPAAGPMPGSVLLGVPPLAVESLLVPEQLLQIEREVLASARSARSAASGATTARSGASTARSGVSTEVSAQTDSDDEGIVKAVRQNQLGDGSPTPSSPAGAPAPEPELEPKPEPEPEKRAKPSLRALARFAKAEPAQPSASEQAAHDEVQAAAAQRDHVREMIQRVADESDRLELEVAAAQARGEEAPPPRRARALRSFVAMRDGAGVSEVAAGEVLLLLDAEPGSRWWTGHVEDSPLETAGEFLQKFVGELQPDGAPALAVAAQEPAGDGLETLVAPDIGDHLERLQALLGAEKEPEPGNEGEENAGKPGMTPEPRLDEIERSLSSSFSGSAWQVGRLGSSSSSSAGGSEGGADFNKTTASQRSAEAKRLGRSVKTYGDRLGNLEDAQASLADEIQARLARLTGGAPKVKKAAAAAAAFGAGPKRAAEPELLEVADVDSRPATADQAQAPESVRASAKLPVEEPPAAEDLAVRLQPDKKPDKVLLGHAQPTEQALKSGPLARLAGLSAARRARAGGAVDRLAQGTATAGRLKNKAKAAKAAAAASASKQPSALAEEPPAPAEEPADELAEFRPDVELAGGTGGGTSATGLMMAAGISHRSRRVQDRPRDDPPAPD
jgi:hypothetical protein